MFFILAQLTELKKASKYWTDPYYKHWIPLELLNLFENKVWLESFATTVTVLFWACSPKLLFQLAQRKYLLINKIVAMWLKLQLQFWFTIIYLSLYMLMQEGQSPVQRNHYSEFELDNVEKRGFVLNREPLELSILSL